MKYLFVINLLLLLPSVVFGQSDITYSPLIIGGGLNTDNLGSYINSLYLLSISVAALLATIKLIIAGAKYMLSDVVTTQGEAKKEIQSSLLGLLLVISAVLILTIINPALITNELNIQRAAPTDLDLSAPTNPAAQNQAAAETAAAAVSAGCGGRRTITDPTDPAYESVVVDYSECPSQNMRTASPLRRECDDIPGGIFSEVPGRNQIVCRYRRQTTDPRLPSIGSTVSLSREYTIRCREEFAGNTEALNSCVPNLRAACQPEPFFGNVTITNGSDATCTLPDVIGYPRNDSLMQLDCSSQRGRYRVSGDRAFCIGCLGLTSQCSYRP
jgi:hypothetical protein